MPNYRIRDCHRDDLEKINELERNCFPNSPALPMVALVQYFDLFQKTFVVAEAMETVVGFAIAGTCSMNSQSAWILDAAVRSEYRKLGIASAMLEELVDRLKQGGVLNVKATVSPTNAGSRRMLEKCGFQTTREIDEYFGKGESRLFLEELILR
jgi:ribosomal-protein-alanine N-acetyltransferase